jgi:ATP-dependent DNA helicase RecG
MDDQELEQLRNDLRCDRVERKRSIADKSDILQAICAFANDMPNHRRTGVVFVGVNNDGTCANLPIDDQLLLTLGGMRSDGKILPFPTITVQKRHLCGCELSVVLVEPSDAPPVRLDGRTWIRVGPRKATATPEEERRLAEKRRFRDLPFDLRPAELAGLDDLDLDLFVREYLPSALPQDVLAANQRSAEQQLAGLRFASVQAPIHPTMLGLLVVGKDPRQFIPGAYVQFLRIDGMELTDPVKDQKALSGPLNPLLRMVEETLTINISTSSEFAAQPVETRRQDYPLAALQQLVRNAILHRAYDATYAPVRIYWFQDRIEILNPGGPFGLVNRDNFGQPGVTDYRNPHLAEAMKNLGYIQRFGVGIALARRELERNGNPPLQFTVEDTHVLAVVRRRA